MVVAESQITICCATGVGAHWCSGWGWGTSGPIRILFSALNLVSISADTGRVGNSQGREGGRRERVPSCCHGDGAEVLQDCISLVENTAYILDRTKADRHNNRTVRDELFNWGIMKTRCVDKQMLIRTADTCHLY